MEVSPVHLFLMVIAVGIGLMVPVIYLFLAFSAVRLLRDIRDALRGPQHSG